MATAHQKLNFQRSIDKMGQGAILMLMHNPKANGGKSYYLMPGGLVANDVAEKLIAAPNVQSNADGLLPDHPQSWSIIKSGAK